MTVVLNSNAPEGVSDTSAKTSTEVTAADTTEPTENRADADVNKAARTTDTAHAAQSTAATDVAHAAQSTTTTEVVASIDSDTLGHDSLSHQGDDSRRASALNLEGLSSDRRSQVLETRLRTVRYVLKHQSAINDELVAYCNMCHSWMQSVHRALSEHNIVLDTPVPPAFRLQQTLTPSSTLPPDAGAGSSAPAFNTGTGTGGVSITSPSSQPQQQYNAYPNFRNRRAVSAANVTMGGGGLSSGGMRASRNVNATTGSLENIPSPPSAAHNFQRTMGQSRLQEDLRRGQPSIVPDAGNYQIMKLFAATAGKQREWHVPEQHQSNTAAFTGHMGTPWDVQEYHHNAAGSHHPAFASHQQHAMHQTAMGGYQNMYHTASAAQYNTGGIDSGMLGGQYNPPVDWEIDSEGEDYNRYGRGIAHFPEFDPTRGRYATGGWWNSKGSWDSGMRVGQRRSGGQNRGGIGKSLMAGGGAMKGNSNSINNVGSATGAAFAAAARKQLLSQQQTTTAATKKDSSNSAKETPIDGQNTTSTKVKKENKSPAVTSSTAAASGDSTKTTTDKGNTNSTAVKEETNTITASVKDTTAVADV